MTGTNLIEIFCILDEFCKFFAPEVKKHWIDVPEQCRRNRPCVMSDSEIMTILNYVSSVPLYRSQDVLSP